MLFKIFYLLKSAMFIGMYITYILLHSRPITDMVAYCGLLILTMSLYMILKKSDNKIISRIIKVLFLTLDVLTVALLFFFGSVHFLIDLDSIYLPRAIAVITAFATLIVVLIEVFTRNKPAQSVAVSAPAMNSYQPTPQAPAPMANSYQPTPQAPSPMANPYQPTLQAPTPMANPYQPTPQAPAPMANPYQPTPQAPAPMANPYQPTPQALAPMANPYQPTPQAPAPMANPYQPTPAYQAPVNGWTCPGCGNVNTDGIFCGNCGMRRMAPVAQNENSAWTCPKCGHTLNTGKFCGVCGFMKNTTV